jgi:hypothetical protein
MKGKVMPLNTMPVLLASDEWLKRTHSGVYRRSALLKALDHEISWYQKIRTSSQLARVQLAFDAWKKDKGPREAWRKNARNNSGAFTLLDQQLRGEGDTDVAAGVQAFMAPALVHARLGVLYLFANTKIDDSVLALAMTGAIDATCAGLRIAPKSNRDAQLAGKVLNLGQKPAGLAAGALEDRLPFSWNAVTPSVPKSAASDPKLISWAGLKLAYQTIEAKVKEALAKLWNMLKEKMSEIRRDPGGAALDILPTVLRKVADQMVRRLWQRVAPFIGAGLDLARGVCNLIDSGTMRFREWLAGKSVRTLNGHPGTIVEAIRRAMSMNVCEGLYGTLKGGLSLGMQFASAGASVIVSAVVDLVEALAKTVMRAFEVIRMKMFVSQAQTHWNARDQKDALHSRPIAFNAWFRRYAIEAPALSVLALNSGICGDKMHFLAMFGDDGAVIGQNEFNAGVAYVDSLKAWGSGYLRDAKYSFSSGDPVVTGLLRLATNHRTAQSNGAKAWQFMRSFLNS